MTDRIDYARRDDGIRRLTYAYVRRRDGLPSKAFASYWRNVHGPLCSRLPGLEYYVQQHFTREPGANLWPVADGVRRLDPIFDGAAEIGFADEADEAAFIARSPILFGDEFNLFGLAVAYAMPAGARTFVDREAEGHRNGPDPLHRLHLYLSLKEGPGSPAWLQRTAEAFAASPFLEKLRLHLPRPYDNARPAPPSPNVEHKVEEDWKRLAIVEIAFESALAARRFFETETFQASLAEQAEHLEALGACRVSAGYVFVREGEITTAGLRGGDSAALIKTFGAVNQTSEEVTRLFLQA